MMSFCLRLQKQRFFLLAVAGLFMINSLKGQPTGAGQDSLFFRLSGPKEKMDLVLFGKNLPRDSLRVELMTNPRFGGKKQKLPLAEAIFNSSSGSSESNRVGDAGGNSAGRSEDNAAHSLEGRSGDNSARKPEDRSVKKSEGYSASNSKDHTGFNPASTSEEASPGEIMIFRDLPVQRFLGQDIRENYISLHIKSFKQASFCLSAAYAIGASDYPNQELLQRLLRIIKEKPACLERHSLACYVRPRPLIFEARSYHTLHVEAPVRHLKPGVQEVKWLNILFGGK